MKNLILTTLTVILLFTSCDSGTIGKYKKEPLPDNFTYNIIKDGSNEALEKNELTVEINKKIAVEQIATLAEKLYDSKSKQRRFYIFYLMPGMKVGSGAWATSHFDPELKIEIIGSTTQQDETSTKLTDAPIDGEVIGKWHEEQYTSSNYVIFKKDNKIFMKTIFKSGQVADNELKDKKVPSGTRYDYKEDGYNGEYFILNNDGGLEFYNSENKRFTTGTPKK